MDIIQVLQILQLFLLIYTSKMIKAFKTVEQFVL